MKQFVRMLTNTQKLNLLQKYLGKAQHGATEAMFHCPICNDPKKEKNKLSVRLVDGTYHCWVCDTGGRSFFQLFRKFAPNALSDPNCEELIGPQQDRHSNRVQLDEDEDKVKLPENLHLAGADSKDPDTLAVRQYLIGRGLTTGDMFRWRISATRHGPFRRKAIVPSFDADGEPNYFIARAIDDSPFKYKNCKRQKTEIVFNEIDIDWSKPVTLVEGVFDAMKCPENTIPVLGSSLPRDSLLFKRLWEHGCSVTVAFDPDLKMKSHKVCDALSRAGLDVWQVWAPDGKDFGSMNKDEVKVILQSAKPWMKNDKLVFKIQNISSGSLF